MPPTACWKRTSTDGTTSALRDDWLTDAWMRIEFGLRLYGRALVQPSPSNKPAAHANSRVSLYQLFSLST